MGASISTGKMLFWAHGEYAALAPVTFSSRSSSCFEDDVVSAASLVCLGSTAKVLRSCSLAALKHRSHQADGAAFVGRPPRSRQGVRTQRCDQPMPPASTWGQAERAKEAEGDSNTGSQELQFVGGVFLGSCPGHAWLGP